MVRGTLISILAITFGAGAAQAQAPFRVGSLSDSPKTFPCGWSVTRKQVACVVYLERDGKSVTWFRVWSAKKGKLVEEWTLGRGDALGAVQKDLAAVKKATQYLDAGRFVASAPGKNTAQPSVISTRSTVTVGWKGKRGSLRVPVSDYPRGGACCVVDSANAVVHESLGLAVLWAGFKCKVNDETPTDTCYSERGDFGDVLFVAAVPL